MTTYEPPKRIVVTGAGGNLGRKAVDALLAAEWRPEIVAIDRARLDAPRCGKRLAVVEADLRDPADERWREAVAGGDGVLHLAAENPMPDATWTEAAHSFDMTANLVHASAKARVRRFVFASSNHVMGGYKDAHAGTIPGALTPRTPPWPGTKWRNGDIAMDSTPYAAAKLMGERLCAAAAEDRLTCVSARIGWCQPGDNLPESLSAAGMPDREAGEGQDALRDERWFRNMWLSNRDFGALVVCAFRADPAAWPAPAIVVNGMSANRGMPWEIGSARAWIGYDPQDDVWR